MTSRPAFSLHDRLPACWQQPGRQARPRWRTGALGAALALLCTVGPAPVSAQAVQPAETTTVAASAEPATRSALDALLFYQLLIGEIELRRGQPAVAFEVLMDAARRTRS